MLFISKQMLFFFSLLFIKNEKLLFYRYENQLENLRQQSFNMEQTNYATQTLKDTQTTVCALIQPYTRYQGPDTTDVFKFKSAKSTL